jgi:hypothetical protein
MVQIWSRNRNRNSSKVETGTGTRYKIMLGFPGWHADQALSIGREGDHRGRGARSLSVLNHLHNQPIVSGAPDPVDPSYTGLLDPDP